MTPWGGRHAFEHVLAAARAGDDGAFAEIWRWLHPPLARWLRVVASGDIEDIESEVWMSVARNLASFRGDDDDFRGWVFTIARRRAIDWGRRQQRRPVLAEMELVDVVQQLDEASTQTDTATALAMLRGLTPDQREVLALRVVAGLSVRETAAVVHRTEGAVRVLCHRGLRTLARLHQARRASDEVTP